MNKGEALSADGKTANHTRSAKKSKPIVKPIVKTGVKTIAKPKNTQKNHTKKPPQKQVWGHSIFGYFVGSGGSTSTTPTTRDPSEEMIGE